MSASIASMVCPTTTNSYAAMQAVIISLLEYGVETCFVCGEVGVGAGAYGVYATWGGAGSARTGGWTTHMGERLVKGQLQVMKTLMAVPQDLRPFKIALFCPRVHGAWQQ
jgi:hypothetical protein